ncbi:hypothetical protein HYPSUDRAFT_817754 [Hypholoma sublateritium FD-334 SS-4]|uniref:Uncharacterized protein n=1 Tax=Hypholoma sublateritium (strain FD-334 SS-4) TaxID=945553 RepID=A0A0D2PK68_HYPSF|nr:hypothetical protein HYPSUDRAFT_817754 [Hypholoma sublateritium FD-334 SS-4]
MDVDFGEGVGRGHTHGAEGRSGASLRQRLGCHSVNMTYVGNLLPRSIRSPLLSLSDQQGSHRASHFLIGVLTKPTHDAPEARLPSNIYDQSVAPKEEDASPWSRLAVRPSASKPPPPAHLTTPLHSLAMRTSSWHRACTAPTPRWLSLQRHLRTATRRRSCSAGHTNPKHGRLERG